MQQIFSNTTLTVNQLIEKIDTGELGLPELQRPFIWKDSKVRDLFDSMMCGYPIGYLMLWECPTLEKKKTIGVDTHNYESPKQVIIDGQQRLTSLYAVMKGKKVINSKYDEKAIIISYCPVKNKFEVGYQATKKDPEWIYNISEVFTTSNITKLIINFTKKLDEYRTSKGEVLTDEEQDLISENITALSNLKQHTLPVFDIKANAEEEDVSEIFVRVNSGGVSLKQNDFILTLLSLYWDEGRKEIEQFSKESTYPTKDKTTSYNQITEVTAQDIIRVVMAYAFDRARLKYGYKLLRGADFDKKGAVDEALRDQRFDVLKAKLPDVLNVHNWHEFLKSIMNAGYHSGDLILSGNAIYYTYALYLIAKYRFDASYNENMHLTSLWFFYASLISLYTGSFESTVESHLNSIKELTTFEEYKQFIVSRVEERLTNDYFDITLIGSEGLAVSGRGNNAWNAYVAALNILNAKILFSKSNLLVSKLFEPGTDGNRKSLEKHHLFPKAYLKSKGCYFLWDRDNRGQCKVTTYSNDIELSATRDLLEPGCDTFIRYNQAISILHKVLEKREKAFDSLVSANDPFGYDVRVENSYLRVKPDIKHKAFPNSVKIYYFGWKKDGIGYIDKKTVRKNSDLINSCKIFISRAYGAGEVFPHQILGIPFLAPSGSVCTETYLMIGPFESETIANNVLSYISTKFFRFLVMLKKNTQSATPAVYQFVPMQDFSKPWSDEELYAKYAISNEEIAFIDSMIRPMDLGGDE